MTGCHRVYSTITWLSTHLEGGSTKKYTAFHTIIITVAGAGFEQSLRTSLHHHQHAGPPVAPHTLFNSFFSQCTIGLGWGLLYKNRTSRKIDSRRISSREYFYTVAPWFRNAFIHSLLRRRGWKTPSSTAGSSWPSFSVASSGRPCCSSAGCSRPAGTCWRRARWPGRKEGAEKLRAELKNMFLSMVLSGLFHLNDFVF